jgi:hypothetical protein
VGSEGIAGLYVETHNFGKTVAFWQQLGYGLEFETDHNSGQLRHPGGGAWVFVAERPDAQTLQTHPILVVDDSASFQPPTAGTVERPFTPQHWDVVEAVLRDPDGRPVSVHAPLPEGVSAPKGHG